MAEKKRTKAQTQTVKREKSKSATTFQYTPESHDPCWEQFASAEEIRDAGSRVRILLLLPDAASNPQFQLLSLPAGEEERHVPLDYEAVVAVTHFAVTVPDTPGRALPYHLPAIGTHLKAIAIVPRVILVAHEAEECHVDWRHSELERLKMQAEILPEAMENLKMKALRQIGITLKGHEQK